ncbi:MAG: NAD(P)/FAD-dependent oxidoreductase [Bilophila wadsworthia]
MPVKALGCPVRALGCSSLRQAGGELKGYPASIRATRPRASPPLGSRGRAQFIEKLRAETEDGTYPASVLSRKELEGMLPKVPFGPEVSGGIWSDMDGYVDPLHLMFAFRKSFVRLGGTLFAGERVSEVKPSGKGYTVVCGGRTLECGKAVLAAGLGVRKLAAQLGTDIPVFPNKSQVMLLERIPADVLPIPLLGIARTFGGTVMIARPTRTWAWTGGSPQKCSPPTRNGPSVSGRSWNASASCGSGPGCACGRRTPTPFTTGFRGTRTPSSSPCTARCPLPPFWSRPCPTMSWASRCRRTGPSSGCPGSPEAARDFRDRRPRRPMPRLRTSDRLQLFLKEYGYVRFTSRGGDAALVNVTFGGKPCAVPPGKPWRRRAGTRRVYEHHPLTGNRAPFRSGHLFQMPRGNRQPANRQACHDCP